jgi:hypothetical protein
VKYCNYRSGWRWKRQICHADQTKIREFDYKMRRRPNVFEGLKLAYKYIELLKNLKKFCQKKRSVDKVRLELTKLEETTSFKNVVHTQFRRLNRHSAQVFTYLRLQIRNEFIRVVMLNFRKGYCQCPKLLGVFHGLHEKIVETCSQHCK